MSDRTLVTAGIDVGSSAVKVALMKCPAEGTERLLFGGSERVRRRDPVDVTRDLFDRALTETNLSRDQIDYIATTGEGDSITWRTGHFYGMTTHSRGGLFLDAEIRAIVDVGALHARAVLMDERAKVQGYRMTSQCASGSGQFLENICRYLGVTIDEIGPLSVTGDDPEQCSSICAVLAETDVINMVSRGISIPNILAGIHLSMAGRYVRLLTSAKAEGPVLVTGGLAEDVGLLEAMRKTVARQNAQIEIRAHEKSVLAGAIGAAIWGAFRARKLADKGVGMVAGDRS